MLAFLDHHRPIDVDLFKAWHGMLSLTYMWEKFMLPPVSQFLFSRIIDPHATQKANIGMYSGYDYLLSLQILFVYFLALPSLLHP